MHPFQKVGSGLHDQASLQGACFAARSLLAVKAFRVIPPYSAVPRTNFQGCLLCCRCLLAVRPAEVQSLQRLGKALHEQAAVHYLESARRLIARHAEQRQHLPELNARVSFKVRQPDACLVPCA